MAELSIGFLETTSRASIQFFLCGILAQSLSDITRGACCAFGSLDHGQCYPKSNETARVDEAERALNEYAVAILEVMQKYEAVPVALSHETRQDAERRFQALNEATDTPTIRTAMIDSVIGGDQPMIAQFLNCCRFAAASRVNARVERRYSNLVWPLYAALCDGINRRKALLRNGAGVTALYVLSTINPKEVQRAFVEEREPVWDECAPQSPKSD